MNYYYIHCKHDDLLDGMYYAMKGMYKPSHEEKAETSKSDTYVTNNISWKIA